DHGGVTLRQPADEGVRVGRFGGGLHGLVAGVVHAVGDVVAHRVVEHDRLLGDDPEQGPQRGDGGFAQVDTVHGDPAAGGVVEAWHQVHHRALAGPARSHHRHDVAAPHLERDL